MNGLNEFCKEINTDVRNKGFWDSMTAALECAQACGSDEDGKAIEEAFITQKIMLIVTELGEAVEAMRGGNFGLLRKDTFEDELADVFLRLSDLCGELSLNIEAQIAWKRGYNKDRKHLHGKGF